MSVSDAKGMKELETENARLKRLLAGFILVNKVDVALAAFANYFIC